MNKVNKWLGRLLLLVVLGIQFNIKDGERFSENQQIWPVAWNSEQKSVQPLFFIPANRRATENTHLENWHLYIWLQEWQYVVEFLQKKKT